MKQTSESPFISFVDLLTGVLFLLLLTIAVLVLLPKGTGLPGAAAPKSSDVDQQLQSAAGTPLVTGLTLLENNARAEAAKHRNAALDQAKAAQNELPTANDKFMKYASAVNKERDNALGLAKVAEKELAGAREKFAKYSATLNKERDTALDQVKLIQKELAGAKEKLFRYSATVHDVRLDNERVTKKLAQELKERGIPVELDQRSSKVSLPADFLFATGSADLGERSVDMVAVVARSIRIANSCNIIPCQGNDPVLQTILIEGHSDRQPVGPMSRFSDNWQLSTARAQSFLRGLWQVDPDLAGATNKSGEALFGIAGFGDSRPAGGSRVSNPASYGRDRRIELNLIFAPPVLSPEPRTMTTDQYASPLVDIRAKYE